MITRSKNHGLQIRFSSLSDIGLVRNENQDYFGHSEEGWGYLFVVTDGFGDAEGGKMASRKIVEGLLGEFRSGPPEDPASFVRDALQHINEETYSLKNEKFDGRMMGSTCVAVQIENFRAYVTNVGDSRVYLIRKGEIVQLSRDHSLVQDMVDRGVINKVEAATHPGKNILTEAIGSHSNLKIYCCENPVDLMAGDRVLLCSDGLWGLVDEVQILAIVERYEPPDAVSKLIGAAKKNGGHDNITAQVIQVVGSS